jgi:hypothetical protein
MSSVGRRLSAFQIGKYDKGKNIYRYTGARIDLPMMNMPVVQKSMGCIMCVADVDSQNRACLKVGCLMMVK